MPTTGFQKKTITQKDSLSDRLRNVRKKKQINLAKAEQDTKIRLKYLEAIEKGRFEIIPPSHSKGFIRRYAQYLGLEVKSLEQDLELLSFSTSGKQPFAPRPIHQETRWLITPRVIAGVTSVIVLAAFIGYIIYQVKQFAAPPLLEITKPDNESVVTAETITLEGKTEVGATVFVDNLQASTNSDGTFSYILALRPGLNQITIRSENRIKKDSTKVISVLYQAPPEALLIPSPSPSSSATPSPTPSVNPTVSPSSSPGAKKTKIE